MPNVISDIITKNHQGNIVWFFDENNKQSFSPIITDRFNEVQNLTMNLLNVDMEFEVFSLINKIDNCESLDLSLGTVDNRFYGIILEFVKRNPLKSLKIYSRFSFNDVCFFTSLLKPKLEVFDIVVMADNFSYPFYLNLNEMKNLKFFSADLLCRKVLRQVEIILPENDHPIEVLRCGGGIPYLENATNVNSLKSIREISFFNQMGSIENKFNVFMNSGLTHANIRKDWNSVSDQTTWNLEMFDKNSTKNRFFDSVQKKFEIEPRNCYVALDNVFRYNKKHNARIAVDFKETYIRNYFIVETEITNDVYITSNVTCIYFKDLSLVESIDKFVKFADDKQITIMFFKEVKDIVFNGNVSETFTGYKLNLDI